jgi:hypothetical protein
MTGRLPFPPSGRNDKATALARTSGAVFFAAKKSHQVVLVARDDQDSHGNREDQVWLRTQVKQPQEERE